MDGTNPYFNQDNRNGEILMLSGVWGSGKTHFWKNDVEQEIISKLKEKQKSYVFVSLYGKDSIEELQNEIYQLAYNFSVEDSSDIISSASSVFTKVATFMPKVSLFGLEVELADSAEKVEAENYKQQVEKGIERLKNGGVICFDDFERKSSKIDLNDLFGFITNLTEEFQTKTIIITNQEFFKEKDSEVFSRIKEKSVNKFLLLDPTIDELFDTIYKNKYSNLDEYRDEILEAIKITEEKNARIFIQVLDNCLEYKKDDTKVHEIFMLVLITVLFVKHNIIFRMDEKNNLIIADKVPNLILGKFNHIKSLSAKNEEIFTHVLKQQVSNEYGAKDGKSSEKLKDDLDYIKSNKNMLYQIYKYNVEIDYFKEKDKDLIEKLNNFVESGIL